MARYSGAEHGLFRLPPEPERDPDFRIRVKDKGYKWPTCVRVLPGAPKVIPFFWNARSAANMYEGIVRRLGRRLPTPSRQSLASLRYYAFQQASAMAPPPEAGDFVSHEQYVNEGHWTQAQKEQMLLHWHEADGQPAAVDYVAKAFGKEEFLPATDKSLRIICPRSDIVVVREGRVFRTIDHWWAKHGPTVKLVPIPDRMRYISGLFGPLSGAAPKYYLCTDFTSFEHSLTPLVMRNTELQWIKYLIRNDEFQREDFRSFQQCLGKQSRIRFKHGVAKVNSRMSGDVDTSTGNGMVNWTVIYAITRRLGWTGPLRGVVEGDDGIFAVDGPLPMRDGQPDAAGFAAIAAEFGFTLKLEVHEDFNECGFLQMFYDDTNDTTLVDPVKKLATVSVTLSPAATTPAATLELQYAKNLSLLVEARAVPVVTAFALMNKRILESHGVHTPRWDRADWYHDQLFRPIVNRIDWRTWNLPPSPYGRRQVERLFGVPVSEQIAFEEWCHAQTDFSEIPPHLYLHWFEKRFPGWIDFTYEAVQFNPLH